MEYETTECPCCGAEKEEWCSPMTACPICGWIVDELATPTEPSTPNDGLTLEEAILNFHVFGSIHLPLDIDEP